MATQTVLRAEIDTDLDPKLTSNETISAHAKGGRVVIERRAQELFVGGKKVILYRSDRQQNGKFVYGELFRKELTGKHTLNACVLDFLLENTAFIPDSWKKDWEKDSRGSTISIYFWGTVYQHSHRDFHVRCLSLHDGAWHRGGLWLGSGWGANDSVALLEEPVS